MLVTGTYFPVLGLQPRIGRLLSPADDETLGAHPVVVLGHDFWESRLGADPAIVNKTMLINGRQMTIVGVAPKGFDGTTLGTKPFFYVPTAMAVEMGVWHKRGVETRRSYWLYLFGRLEAGCDARAGEDGDQHRLSPDHQRGRSAAPDGHERPDDDALPREGNHRRGRTPRPERHLQRGEHSADPALLDHRHRAAHRVREHREPAAGAGRQPRDGDGRSSVTRRDAAAVASRSCSRNPSCSRSLVAS